MSLFSGTIKITCDGGATVEVELSATCDSAGLGTALGIAARHHMQQMPKHAAEGEFRDLMTAFLVNALDNRAVRKISGKSEIVVAADAPGGVQ